MKFKYGALMFLTLPTLCASSVTIFSSSSWVLPESISVAPGAFGSLGGQFIVPDAGSGGNNSIVYSVPTGGGTPSQLASFAGIATTLTGTFAPAGFGTLGGSDLVGGYNLTSTAFNPVIYSIAGSGAETPVYSGSNGKLEGSVVGTAAYSNDILFAEDVTSTFTTTGGAILALNSSSNVSTFATLNFAPSNELFAPSGFGTVGGDLLVTDLNSGNIWAVDPSGNVTLFATVPLVGGQLGLRQMAIAPASYGAYVGDLFVSAAASTTGGGLTGSVDVLTPSGAFVAVLTQGTVAAPFDPRGLYFDGAQLLISDADPEILSAPASAFTSPTPEPSSWAMVVIALAGWAAVRKGG